MSKTFIGAILQFFVVLGLITTEELAQLSDLVVALMAAVPLLITIYGRIKAVDKVTWYGLKK